MKDMKKSSSNKNSKIQKILSQVLENKNELIKIGKELGKVLSKLLLLNYLNRIKYVSPVITVIKIVTKWSLYTSLLTYVSTWILGLFTVNLSFAYLIQTLSAIISGYYVLFTEIDLEMLTNLKFSIINEYNKLLAKMIVKMESIPNMTDEIKARINKLRRLFIQIPADKISHEIFEQVPQTLKEEVQLNIKQEINQDIKRTNYYYEEFERMINDPDYRNKKIQEQFEKDAAEANESLKKGERHPKFRFDKNYVDEFDPNYRHRIYKSNTESSFFDKFKFNLEQYKTYIIVGGLVIANVTFGYFFPEQYNQVVESVKSVTNKIKDNNNVVKIAKSVWGIISSFFRGDRPDRPGGTDGTDGTARRALTESVRSLYSDEVDIVISDNTNTVSNNEPATPSTPNPWSASTSKNPFLRSFSSSEESDSNKAESSNTHKDNDESSGSSNPFLGESSNNKPKLAVSNNTPNLADISKTDTEDPDSPEGSVSSNDSNQTVKGKERDESGNKPNKAESDSEDNQAEVIDKLISFLNFHTFDQSCQCNHCDFTKKFPYSKPLRELSIRMLENLSDLSNYKIGRKDGTFAVACIHPEYCSCLHCFQYNGPISCLNTHFRYLDGKGTSANDFMFVSKKAEVILNSY